MYTCLPWGIINDLKWVLHFHSAAFSDNDIFGQSSLNNCSCNKSKVISSWGLGGSWWWGIRRQREFQVPSIKLKFKSIVGFVLYPLENCLCSIRTSQAKLCLVPDSFVTKILITASFWKKILKHRLAHLAWIFLILKYYDSAKYLPTTWLVSWHSQKFPRGKIWNNQVTFSGAYHFLLSFSLARDGT